MQFDPSDTQIAKPGNTSNEYSAQPKPQISLMDLVSEATCKSSAYSSSVGKGETKMPSLSELAHVVDDSKEQPKRESVQLKPASGLSQPVGLMQLIQQEKGLYCAKTSSSESFRFGQSVHANEVDSSPNLPHKSTVLGQSSGTQAASSPKSLSLADLVKLSERQPAASHKLADSAQKTLTLLDLVQNQTGSAHLTLSQVASTQAVILPANRLPGSTPKTSKSAVTFKCDHKTLAVAMNTSLLSHVMSRSVKHASPTLSRFQRIVCRKLRKKYFQKLLMNFDFSTLSPDDDTQGKQRRVFH